LQVLIKKVTRPGFEGDTSLAGRLSLTGDGGRGILLGPGETPASDEESDSESELTEIGLAGRLPEVRGAAGFGGMAEEWMEASSWDRL